MIQDKHKGSEYINKVYIENKDDGMWEVEHTIIHRTSDDLESWEERKVIFMGKNKKLEEAIAEAAVLAHFYLESVQYNLFTEPTEIQEGDVVH